ncbi:NAD-dependent epimerase/dehydratase family protein [Nonomuraea sp. CA-143628]|uniref:NAD-dependent epimerase/dehydratase family protein n=1 Tax=Nonomuraea sp. CA-143628 TaxID=3239997 RepID=UPI003D9193EE
MRVLLAGATGAIGRQLVPALTDAGHHVVAIIRDPGNRDRVKVLGGESIVADVMNREQLLRAVDGISADAVMHQATALRGASPRLRTDDPTNALRSIGTTHLLEAAQVVGAGRFVTQSLITGYGYLDHGDRELTEEDPFGQPRGTYGDPVVEGCRSTEEQVLKADGIALRYGMFYGPHAFSDTFADLMRKHLPILPAGDSGSTSWIHVADAAGATVAALERGRSGQAYNVVDDTPITWGQFAATVAAAHHTPRPKAMPRWLLRLSAPYLACLMADTSMRVSHAKATRELGWTPSHPSIHEGLRGTEK